MSTAAQRWSDALATWAVPKEILDQAPVAPWVHPPKMFMVGDDVPAPDSPSTSVARGALGAGGTVLDVGCGGGGSSIPLGGSATHITGVDESAEMLANFAAACAARGIAHTEVQGRWPDVAASVEPSDVVVCHHVAYNVPDIGSFVAALTAHARRRVVVELPDRHPMSPFNGLWKRFWNLDRPTEPSADLFVQVVVESGHEPAVARMTRPPRKSAMDPDEYLAFVRQRLCLTKDRDAELATVIDDLRLQSGEIVTVSWAP